MLNRLALWNHVPGNLARRSPGLSREAALAVLSLGLTLLLFVGHAFHPGR